MRIHKQLTRVRNWLDESLRPTSVNLGYQPKTVYTGGMFGSHVSPLDEILDLAQKLKDVRENTTRKYGDDVEIAIYLERIASENKPIFRVGITERKKGILEPALKEFLTHMGKPSAVYNDVTLKSNSETGLIAKVLREITVPGTC